jgi:hypothetical protein
MATGFGGFGGFGAGTAAAGAGSMLPEPPFEETLDVVITLRIGELCMPRVVAYIHPVTISPKLHYKQFSNPSAC